VPQEVHSQIREVEQRQGVREKAFLVNEEFCGWFGFGSFWFVGVRLSNAGDSRGVPRGVVTSSDDVRWHDRGALRQVEQSRRCLPASAGVGGGFAVQFFQC
jgi:hypothetical protein